MTEIVIDKVTKIYGGRGTEARAVDRVSLPIEAGELFFLLGPSGCGKTTLLRIIAGLIEPTAGRVLFNGEDLTRTPVEKRNTPMVFQSYALWPHLTVRQNVEFGPAMHGVRRRRRRELSGEYLERVQLGDYTNRKPNQLSGGQQQRVALARALAVEGRCLLLDEPLSNLDAQLRLRMREQLRGLVKESGITAVYVTHDQTEALSMADRIAVMREGRIVQVDAPEALYDRPKTRFVADFLGEANFIDGTLRSAYDVAAVDTPVGEVQGRNESLQLGTPVTCCLRPERIRFAESGLPATVEHATYLGDLRQYRCRLADGSAWKVSHWATQPAVEPGSRVHLYADPRQVAILPRN